MTLTRSLVESSAREYRDVEPFYTVEQETVETLPAAVRRGDYGWRDVEWIVQWYFRRHMGRYPDRERRAIENQFRENDYEDVRDVLGEVVAEENGAVDGETGDVFGGEREDELEFRIDRLTALEGVDVRLASAFLLFLFPKRYVVVGEREWGVLVRAGELEETYSDPPSVEEYLLYQDRCSDLLDRFDVDAWTFYRAIWRLGTDCE